ncbi:MAG: hypothetical protein QNJ64_03570 [Crocosphaera sp.]|nr:hypothetical protein [Crocosphaera sp.]
MSLLNKFTRSLKIVVVTFSVLLCLLVSNVMAAQAFCLEEGPVTITKGSFDFSTKNDSPEFTVRSAIVSLPEGESGNIDEIVITGPDGQREFGCFNIKGVANGTNLISDCGGPAVLKAGNTVYQAKGSGFNPESDITNFSIKLCDTFAAK